MTFLNHQMRIEMYACIFGRLSNHTQIGPEIMYRISFFGTE